MRIISWNVNGLRSVERHGFVEWVSKEQPDIICLQEIKLQEDQLTDTLRDIPGYTAYFSYANKKGYSGVGIYTRTTPLHATRLLGFERFDQEGRFLQLEYDSFILINLYMPHGGRQKEHLEYKLVCYTYLLDYLQALKTSQKKPLILVGDFNIAHTELDLARARQNQKNIMFTPQERALLNQLIATGFIDAFRTLYPTLQAYTWWPWLASARERNIGWRLDYGFISTELLPQLEKLSILREVSGSDHCPICLQIKTAKSKT